MKPLYKRWGWKGNHGSEQPSRMIVYDTETITSAQRESRGISSHTLRLGVASFWARRGGSWQRKQQCVFRTPEQFWQFVYGKCQRRQPLWVYSHNAAFDFSIVRGWDELSLRHLRTEQPGRTYTPHGQSELRTARPYRGLLAIDGVPWIVEAISDRGVVKLCDSLNYFPVKLEEIAHWVGMQKCAMPTWDMADDDWLTYCKHDVAILETAIIRLMEFWGGRKLGTWQTTLGRLAYASFRHIRPDSGITAHGDDPYDSNPAITAKWRSTATELDAAEVADVERRAYFGGRVIVAFQGDVAPDGDARWFTRNDAVRSPRPAINGPVEHFDVNSLYASVMRDMTFPVRLLQTYRRPTFAGAIELIEHFPCVADVLIDTVANEYPLRQNNTVRYVAGRFATSLAGVELANAVKRCDVIQISNLCVYAAGKPFTEFVDYWSALRIAAIENGDKIMGGLCKGVLTSLFGKLAQRRPEWEMAKGIAPLVPWGGFVKYDPETKRFTKYRSVARVVQREGERRECGHTMTATAAAITAAAREFMDMLRGLLPRESFLYQDTDSLFVTAAGADALHVGGMIHPTELGCLKHCGTYAAMSIYGPKTYIRDGELVAAGLGTPHVEVMEGVYKYTAFERAGSIIAREADGSVRSWQATYVNHRHAARVPHNDTGWRSIEYVNGSVSE